MNLRTTFFSLVASIGLLVSMGASQALAVDPLIEATPSSVTVDVPAPGHSVDWQMRVQNLSGAPVPLYLSVKGAGATLFSGPNPIEISIVDSAGTVIVPQTPAGPLLGTKLQLADLAAGDTYELRGEVALPAAADNRYQGRSGTLTFVFTTITGATDPAPGVIDSLVRTGVDLMPYALVAVALLGAGFALAGTRRKRAES